MTIVYHLKLNLTERRKIGFFTEYNSTELAYQDFLPRRRFRLSESVWMVPGTYSE